jgi:SpoIIAA-like
MVAAMIELMDGMTEGTLGFRVSGEVERSDYTDVMVPELRKAVEQGGGGLRTLYLIDRLEEMEAGALWEDTKAGFDLGIRHHSAWQRTALVTDQEWIARSARLLAWMAPGEFKVFPVAELEEAKAWVSG